MRTLHTIPHGDCLIQTLVDDLSRRSPKELQQTLLLLPTRRLQMHVAAHLATIAKGSSWLPQMLTWDQFLENESFVFVNQNMVMVSSMAELILADLLKSHAKESQSTGKGISDRHAHELLHFLKELWRHGKRADGLEKLEQWLKRQWQIDPEAIDDICERTSRIYAVLDDFEQNLHQQGYALQEEIDANALSQWIIQLQNLSWRPTTNAERIIIAGLTSLPDHQIELLKHLAGIAGVECWLDMPWRDLPKDAPLRRIRSEIQGHDSLPLLLEDQARVQVTRLHSAADPFSESALALERARAAMARGIESHRIAILVPDESQYASSLAILSEQMGISRNTPLARPWVATQAGAWFEMLQNWVSTKDSVAFATLLLSPYSKQLITPEGSPPELFRDDTFATQVSQWLRDVPRTIDTRALFELSLVQSHLSDVVVDVFKKAWEIFRGGDLHSFEDHSQFWRTYFNPHIEAQLKHQIEPMERIGWQSLLTAEASLNRLSQRFLQHTKSWSGFIKALAQIAKDTTPRETGEPLADLQIISITEARYVPLDVAIIVGCVEGIFPHRVPRDSLVDQTLKSALNLPGWQQLEALEDSTFGLLVSRIPEVELLWPETIAEATTVRSRWVEKIHAQGMPIIQDAPQNLTELFESNPVQRSFDAASDLEGKTVRADQSVLLSSVSASSLKALMACPYQFLLRQRGVKSFSPRDHEDPIVMGTLLHRVIELCLRPHDAIEKRIPQGHLWRKSFRDANDVVTWAEGRLRSISDVVIPKTMRETPEIMQIVERSWSHLASDWGSFYELGWNPANALVEHQFGTVSQPVFLKIGEKTIAVTGAIDVVHFNDQTGEWLISDYKTGNPPSPAAVKQGLEPQLVLYSMCLESTEAGFKPQRGVISYRSLKTGTFQTISLGKDIQSKWSNAFGECRLDLASLIKDFTDQWLSRIQQIEQHERFFADANHCGYCQYTDVCRKDDPRYHDRIRAQSRSGGQV